MTEFLPFEEEKENKDNFLPFGEVEPEINAGQIPSSGGNINKYMPEGIDPEIAENTYKRAAQRTIENLTGLGLEEQSEFMQEETPTTGNKSLDTLADVSGNIVGSLTKLTALSSGLNFALNTPGLQLAKPLAKLPAAAERALKTGTIFAGLEATGDIVNEEKSTPKDYTESFLSGAALGGAGQATTDIIRNVTANIPINDTVYPFVEKIASGVSAGAAKTGVEKAFNPEEVDMEDLGLNMATIAIWYTMPMLSKSNRQSVNQARNYIAEQKNKVDKKAVESLKKLGLDKSATEQQIKQAWQAQKSRTTKGDLSKLSEREKLQFLSDTKAARDTARQYIEDMPISTYVKNAALKRLGNIAQSIRRVFVNPETALVPVQPGVTQQTTMTPPDISPDLQQTGEIATEEISGALTEPVIEEEVIQLGSDEALGPPVIELFPESQTYMGTDSGETFVSGGEETELPKVNRKIGPQGEYLGNEINIDPQQQTSQDNEIDINTLHEDGVLNSLQLDVLQRDNIKTVNVDNIDNLADVKGIGPKTIGKLKDYVNTQQETTTQEQTIDSPDTEPEITEVETKSTEPIKIENMNKRAQIFAKKYGFFDNTTYMPWIAKHAKELKNKKGLSESATLPDEEFNNYLKEQPIENDIVNRIEEIKEMKKDRLKEITGATTKNIPGHLQDIIGKDGEKYTVENDNVRYKYIKLQDAIKKAQKIYDKSATKTGQITEEAEPGGITFTNEDEARIKEAGKNAYISYKNTTKPHATPNGGYITTKMIEEQARKARGEAMVEEKQKIKQEKRQEKIQKAQAREDAEIKQQAVEKEEQRIKGKSGLNDWAGQQGNRRISTAAYDIGNQDINRVIIDIEEGKLEYSTAKKVIDKAKELKVIDEPTHNFFIERIEEIEGKATPMPEEPQSEEIVAPQAGIAEGDRIRWTTEPVNGETTTHEGIVKIVQSAGDTGNRYIIENDKGQQIKTYDYKGDIEKIEKSAEKLKPIEPKEKGKIDKVVTPQNTEIEVQYEVADINQIITSHDENLKENSKFPKEAQPRDRTKIATEIQVQDIYKDLDPERLAENRLAAHGAPIIGPDGAVETGNARTIALKRLYRDNHQNTEEYKQWLQDNAERFGLDPDKVAQIEKPILVKERKTNIDRQTFTQEANIDEKAKMSTSEQAMVDADRLTQNILNKFVPHDDGLINIKANNQFINEFLDKVVGKTGRGEFLTKDGDLNQAGIRRVKNALFASAYNNTEVMNEIAETTDSNLKNVTGAMMEAAPRMVEIQKEIEKGKYVDLDISNDLVKAVRLYKKIKQSDKTVEEYFTRDNLWQKKDYTSLEQELVEMFNKNKRSRKKLREILINYTYGFEESGRADMQKMFGDIKPPTKEEVLLAARKVVEGDVAVGQTGFQFKETEDQTQNSKLSNVQNQNEKTSKGEEEQLKKSIQKSSSPLEFAEEEVTPINRKEINEFIFNELLPASQGRMFNKSAEGEYNPKEETIKLKKDSDLMTKAHELGHHLIRQIGVKSPKQIPKEALDEVIRIFKKSGLKQSAYDESQYWNEGNSEFWKLYLADAKKAEQVAPNYFNFLDNRVEKSKSKDKIRQLQDYYYRWFHQPVEEQVRGSIARNGMEKKDYLTPMQKLMNIFVDDKRPYKAFRDIGLNKMDKKPINYIDMLKNNPDITLGEVRKEGLTLLEDPYRMARAAPVLEEPIIHALVNDAQIDPNRQIIGPSLTEILKPISDYLGTREKIGDFETWAVAIHGLERLEKGKSIGISEEKLETTIERLEQPGFKKAMKELQEFNENVLDWYVNYEMLDEEAKKTIADSYKWYIPLNRLFEHQGLNSIGGSRLVDLPSPVKRAYGSSRIIKSPFESLIHNMAAGIKNGLKNKILANMYRLSQEAEGMGGLVETVATPIQVKEIALKTIKGDLREAGVPDDIIENMDLEHIAKSYQARHFASIKDKKENVHTVRLNGKARFIRINDETLNKTIQDFEKNYSPRNYDNPVAKWLGTIASIPAKGVKVGATSAPWFAPKNAFRDQKTGIYLPDNSFIPIIETLKGLKSLGKGEETEIQWRVTGGSRGGIFDYFMDFMSEKDASVKSLIEDTEEYGVLRQFTNLLGGAWNAYQKNWSRASEEGTRYGHFKNRLEQFDLEGKSPLEKRLILMELAEEARAGVNLDFSMKGKATRAADHYIPFTGAAVNNLYRVYESMEKAPLKTGLTGLLLYTIPSIVRYMVNRNKPEYQEMDLWQKVNYNNYILPGGKIITLPIAFTDEVIFGKVPQLMLSAMDKVNPESLKDITKALSKNIIGSNYPSILSPFIGLWKNEKPYTGIPLIPQDQTNIEPMEQYGDYTYELPKAMSKIFNEIPGTPDVLRSPRKLQMFINQWGSTLGGDVMSLYDLMSGKRDIGETAQRMFPVVREPIGQVSIDKIYDLRNKYQRTVNTFEKQVKERGNTTYSKKELFEAKRKLSVLNNITKQLSQFRKQKEIIDKNNNLPEETKGRMKEKIDIMMLNVARKVLGKETFKGW